MTRMHVDELDLPVDLVERLVADQLPQWAGLPVQRVESSGTDNAMFRLGDDLVARMPGSTGQPGAPSTRRDGSRGSSCR